MTNIADNTFAAACYDTNSITDLVSALENGPDAFDMEAWNLTATEWVSQIELALKAKREDLNG